MRESVVNVHVVLYLCLQPGNGTGEFRHLSFKLEAVERVGGRMLLRVRSFYICLQILVGEHTNGCCWVPLRNTPI